MQEPALVVPSEVDGGFSFPVFVVPCIKKPDPSGRLRSSPHTAKPSPPPSQCHLHPFSESKNITCTSAYWSLRMCYYASWQNFVNIGSPASFTSTARTTPRFRAWSWSQSKHIFDLHPIPQVLPRSCKHWPECHCACVHIELLDIILNVTHFFQLRWPEAGI